MTIGDRVVRGNQDKMKSLECALIQYGVLIRRGNLDTDRYIRRIPGEHEDSHLQAKERDLEQLLLSQTSEGTNPADTLISGF